MTPHFREVKRVLRPEGILLSITFSQPHHRVPLLAQTGLDWTVQVGLYLSTSLPLHISTSLHNILLVHPYIGEVTEPWQC